MAAPVSEPKLECPQCRRVYAGYEVLCPNCGAVLMQGLTAAEAEQVHRELAEANVKRVRGDLQGAKDACVSVLRTLPSNVGAHLMLAEICEAQGIEDQALDWYQLALDIDPDVPLVARKGVAQKIESLKKSIALKESRAKAEALSLPGAKAPRMFSIGVLVVSVIVVGSLAFIAGWKTETKALERLMIRGRVSAPPASTGVEPLTQTVKDQEPARNGNGEISPRPNSVEKDGSTEDQILFQSLAQKSSFGDHMLAVASNPRNNSLTITFVARQDERGKKVGAELARAAFQISPKLQLVVLRGIRNGKLAYVSDSLRETWEETETQEWKVAHPGEEDYVNYLMSNEWFANGSNDSGSDGPPPSN